jgi:hypothetical protein
MFHWWIVAEFCSYDRAKRLVLIEFAGFHCVTMFGRESESRTGGRV